VRKPASLFTAGVAVDAPLMDSGLDSLGAVEFRSSLEARLSLQLPPTLVFDYPSLSAIVGYLDTTLAAQQGSYAETDQQTASTATPAFSAAPSTGPALQLAGAQAATMPVIAILATHGRFPEPDVAAAAASKGLAGRVCLRDGISVVPVERYDVEMQLTEDMPARFGGFIPGAQVCLASGVQCTHEPGLVISCIYSLMHGLMQSALRSCLQSVGRQQVCGGE
jgi:hypothetical protein